MFGMRLGQCAKLLAVLAVMGAPAIADVLPDDRADVLYHNYDGGGITIQGPSVLVRKKVGDNNISFFGSYYEDLISSASIDVEAVGLAVSRDPQTGRWRSRCPPRQDHLHRRLHSQP